MIFRNGADLPLNANSGTLPQMDTALSSYFQSMTFTTIVKTVVNFQVVETPTAVSFNGVWQPFSARQLMLKPEGERSWSWFMLHAEPSLVLKVDDVVNFLGVQYRVMQQTDYSLYGYVQYQMVQDWEGSGP